MAKRPEPSGPLQLASPASHAPPIAFLFERSRARSPSNYLTGDAQREDKASTAPTPRPPRPPLALPPPLAPVHIPSHTRSPSSRSASPTCPAPSAVLTAATAVPAPLRRVPECCRAQLHLLRPRTRARRPYNAHPVVVFFLSSPSSSSTRCPLQLLNPPPGPRAPSR